MDFALFNYLEKDIIHIKFSPVLPTREEFTHYLDVLTDYIYTDEGLYLIFDTSYAPYLPSEFRKLQAEWIKIHKEQIINSVVTTIHVIPNAIQRSIFNAIFIIQKPVTPFKIVADFKDAIMFLNKIKTRKNVA